MCIAVHRWLIFPAVSVHVAILHKAYLKLVLTGEKTVESRLYRSARPPYGAIQPGERIYLKLAGGPFTALARAGRVEHHEALGPDDVDALHRRFEPAVRGGDAYWHAKRAARYATFVELVDVEPIDVGPAYRSDGYRAWFVLPDDADPVHDVTLSAGALRNRYVIPGRWMTRPPTIALHLPDGRVVTTQRTPRGHLRWRGWGAYFHAHAVAAGDRVRFVRLGEATYRVSFPDSSGGGTASTTRCHSTP